MLCVYKSIMSMRLPKHMLKLLDKKIFASVRPNYFYLGVISVSLSNVMFCVCSLAINSLMKKGGSFTLSVLLLSYTLKNFKNAKIEIHKINNF